jgi:hypothetical protein
VDISFPDQLLSNALSHGILIQEGNVVIIDLRITNLGLILLAATYALPFLMLRRLRSGNAPEKLPSQSYAAAFAGKIFGSIILSLLATPVENTPVFGLIAPIRA